MIKYNNIDYLTLPQQVEKNRDEIDKINALIDGTISADIMWGTATVYTESPPFYGLRIIDSVQLQVDDTVLVAGNGDDNGVYQVTETTWIRTNTIEVNQVVSIDSGEIYGGSQLKKLLNGVTKVVKKPERMKWRAY